MQKGAVRKRRLL